MEDKFGEWIEEENQIGNLLVQYYSNLFTSSNPTQLDIVLNRVEPRVSEEMNEQLLRPFEASELHNALKQMESITTPGLDGLLPLFYKQFWSKVGHEDSDAILAVLNSRTIPNNINHTFLTIIPKVHSPRKETNFRLISLTYKSLWLRS